MGMGVCTEDMREAVSRGVYMSGDIDALEGVVNGPTLVRE